MAETTSGTTNYLYVYPDCPFRNVCSDNGKKCETCRHNPRRSYYEPVEPYYPWSPYPWSPYPWYPYYPYWQPWTITYSTTNATDTTYYQSV